MNIKKNSIIMHSKLLCAVAFLLSSWSALQAITIEFDEAGYNNGALNSHPDWTGNNAFTNSPGVLTLDGTTSYRSIVYGGQSFSNNIGSNVTGQYTFRFTKTSTLDWKDMPGIKLYEAVNTSSSRVATYMRTVNGGSYDLGGGADFSGAAVGINADGDTSNWLRLTTTFTKSATADTYDIQMSLFNVDSGATVSTYSTSISAPTGVYNASSVFIGFGYGRHADSAIGMSDYRVDSFTASSVPEASSYALILGLLSTWALFMSRRRRVQ